MDDSTAGERYDLGSLASAIRAAGVAGAGGAGFPSYVKWQAVDDVEYLLVNHQESEPPFYADKWIGHQHAGDLADFLGRLLDGVFDAAVVGTKEKYWGEWTDEFEAATGATAVGPDDLPLSIEDVESVAFAYTPDVYTYSEESVLLMVTAGVAIGDGLPTGHGWLVHNTETLYNVHRAIDQGEPVTRKFVHVDGNTPRHRCLDVPIGTPGSVLLEAAGVDGLREGQLLADGGPGWCYEIAHDPASFGVRKRTNGLLVLDEDVARERAGDDGEIDVLDAYDWDGLHETEPTTLEPDRVRIPLITNEAYEGLVHTSEPVVEPGEDVQVGDVIAEPSTEGISNTQHASIDGTVVGVADGHVVIER
jgi:Na+-translocating ferredoxin:NAD+ oxidoreductase RnfC subunit